MSSDLDWSSFYLTLCSRGSLALSGLDDDDRELIDVIAGAEDTFWSSGLQASLEDVTEVEGLRGGVLAALDVWRDNVLSGLREFGVHLSRSKVAVDADSPVVDELMAAARPS